MESIIDFMGKDHDRLDKIFIEFRDFENKEISIIKSLFHDFKIGLQRHIVWEEEILFPIFEQKTGMYDFGPTAVMREEHKQIKNLLKDMHNHLINNNIEPIKRISQDLLELLRIHNDKEEGILYPEIDGLINDEEKNSIYSKIRELPAEKYEKCCES